LDSKNYRIQVFDKSGKFVHTIGKKGQGPGEFSSPVALWIDSKNKSVYVADYRSMKIVIFSMDGKYLDKDVLFDLYPKEISVDGKKNIWGIFSSLGYTTTLYFKQYSFEGKEIDSFMEKPFKISSLMISRENLGSRRTRVGGFFSTMDMNTTFIFLT